MGRSPCCSKVGLNRGAWTAMEDKILTAYIKAHGEGKWRNLPKRAGLKRCGKSCRLRWLNYLRPDIKRGNISRDEEELIIRLHNLLGNRWSLIAGRLPGRTDNEVKNYWNTTLGKKAKSSSARSPTSAPLPRGKASSLVSSDPPTSTPAAKVTRPQVVRARATRCTVARLSISNHNPPFHDQNFRLDSNSQILHSINRYSHDVEIPRIHFGTDLGVQENGSTDFDFTNFWCGNERLQAIDDDSGGKGNYFGSNYYNNHMPMEEAILENWASNGGDSDDPGVGIDEVKDMFDIESLKFFIDSEQWTCPECI